MTVLATPASCLAPLAPPVRRFTVDEYHRLIHAGILAEGERVELLDGLIVPKMTRNPPHDATLQLLNPLLLRLLPAGWQVRVQSALTTAESEPGPDLAVVRGDPRAYVSRHPGPSDVGLVIEVADSSLAHDRGFRAGVYARAGIVAYWIVNLVDSQVEVYTDPTGPDPQPRYRHRQDYRPADSLPLVLDGREVARVPVADLLP